MEKALRELNRLKRQGIIGDYAIGGGIAVLYYAEPVLTYDLDIFASLPETPGGLVDIPRVYRHLQERGYTVKGRHIDIGGTLVELIPIPLGSTLEKEAIEKALDISYKSVRTSVLGVQHLIAILLKAGRHKDLGHIRTLLDQADVDMKSLEDILERHGLRKRWLRFVEDGK